MPRMIGQNLQTMICFWNDATDEGWHDLSGRQFAAPLSHGVYIHKGKKVVF